MNERLKKLRKALDLTQQEFADRIRVKRNTVATYEMGRSGISDAAISLICKEFNVNEAWLRTGEGDMFIPEPASELEAIAKKYDLSHEAYLLIEKFVTLSKDKQDIIIDFVKAAAASMAEDEAEEKAAPGTKVRHITKEQQDYIDAEVEAYRRTLELQEKIGG